MDQPQHLAPPEGYSSWLDYAVETIDTRSLWAVEMFGDNPPDQGAIREAVREELRQLRKAAGLHLSGKQGVDAG